MPSPSPAPSSPERIAIVARSARALTEAARRAGLAPIAIDLFGDLDLRASAAAWCTVAGDVTEGPDLDETLAALSAHAATAPLAGVILGGGFEHRAAAIDQIAARWPVLGPSAVAVERVKSPQWLARTCRRHGIPHPEIATAPGDGAWLAKTARASGGHHVRVVGAPVVGESDPVAQTYYQRRIDGRSLSAAFMADGHSATLLAFCEIHVDPAPDAPFRHGAVIGPVAVPQALATEVAAALTALTGESGLIGLCGADLIAGPDSAWWLIEINPRPTAALDVLDRGAPSLLALHLAACRGQELQPFVPPADPAGAAVLYADADLTAPNAEWWPAFTADRGEPGSPLPAGGPICTILAEAPTSEAASVLLAARICEVRRALFL